MIAAFEVLQETWAMDLWELMQAEYDTGRVVDCMMIGFEIASMECYGVVDKLACSGLAGNKRVSSKFVIVTVAGNIEDPCRIVACMIAHFHTHYRLSVYFAIHLVIDLKPEQESRVQQSKVLR
jgi:hypothetical protein